MYLFSAVKKANYDTDIEDEPNSEKTAETVGAQRLDGFLDCTQKPSYFFKNAPKNPPIF
ncbi:hypothetical protein GCM10010978_09950 [Compostibacillus humi]|uniref:Uncharacterized protein n=1 Tax=Compostibacillus humi TaxID=1245525 RepID=A0A8J2ZQP1_9BACI|nr:hypothetical protein GCM10010978_09950 [Compostibacillus humi]